MVIKTEEKQLLEALMEQDKLIQAGLIFDIAEDAGVVISQGTHVRGFWRFQSGRFAWTPAGYAQPEAHADTLADVIVHTNRIAGGR